MQCDLHGSAGHGPPELRGTYVYANRQLGQWAGFTAGWGFVTGKTASAAGMSMAFGLYAASLLGIDDADAAARALAVAAIVVLTGVNLGGITRTAGLTRILVSVVLLILAVVAGLAAAALSASTMFGAGPSVQEGGGGALGVLPAAGLLFFAFAGYARVATMAEEVRDPQRTIPRAILGRWPSCSWSTWCSLSCCSGCWGQEGWRRRRPRSSRPPRRSPSGWDSATARRRPCPRR